MEINKKNEYILLYFQSNFLFFKVQNKNLTFIFSLHIFNFKYFKQTNIMALI